MLGNDISNRTAPVICFNIDSLLFTNNKKKRKLLDRLFSYGNNDYLERELNFSVVNLINNLWFNYDFSIYLTTKESFLDDISEILYEYDICHTRLFQYPSIEFLRDKVYYEYHLYVDDNLQNLSEIGRGNAIPLSELPKHIRTVMRG